MFDDLQCEVKEIKGGIVYTDDVQYGRMSWYLIGGRPCCSTILGDLNHYPSSMYVGDRFYGATIVLKHVPGEPSVFAKHKEDVLNIARDLSTLGGETAVIIHARIVARFKDGELVGEVRTLDEFYNNLSEDEVNATDLTGTLDD